MPAQILHVLFGEDSLNRAAAGISEGSGEVGAYIDRILGDKAVFFALGCQGPDIFYHNQHTRPVSLEYGTLLHRRGYGDFTARPPASDYGRPVPRLGAERGRRVRAGFRNARVSGPRDPPLYRLQVGLGVALEAGNGALRPMPRVLRTRSGRADAGAPSGPGRRFLESGGTAHALFRRRLRRVDGRYRLVAVRSVP